MLYFVIEIVIEFSKISGTRKPYVICKLEIKNRIDKTKTDSESRKQIRSRLLLTIGSLLLISIQYHLLQAVYTILCAHNLAQNVHAISAYKLVY